MRRLFVAVALAAVVATGAACGGSNEDGGSGTGSNPPAAADNTKDICATLETKSNEFATKVGESVTPLQTAGGDMAKLTAAIQAVQTAFTDYVAVLRTEAGKATNADLKSSLETFATALDTSAKQLGDPAAIAADPSKIMSAMTAPEVEAASTALEKHCG